jgi:4-hydroxy-3-polyprenylbenzoate decarboxylase
MSSHKEVISLEIVIGISGASGVGYGIRLLQVLQGSVVHLVMTDSARKIIKVETNFSPEDVEDLADHVYAEDDFTAPIASGSYRFDAMVIIPCSMKTLAGVASGMSDNLIGRSAEICLKDRRRLVIVPRETPLSLIQLRNMVSVTEAGAVVLPACPAFYSRPQNLEDLFDVLVGRVLDSIGVENNLYPRWKGNAYNGSDQSGMR